MRAGLRIKENKEVYEGEITELTPEYTEAPAAGGGYGKAVSHVVIGLKTVKGAKQLKLDPTIYDALIKVSNSVQRQYSEDSNGRHCTRLVVINPDPSVKGVNLRV